MGYGPQTTCHVPRSLGKLSVRNTDEGMDFSALDPYIRKRKESPPPDWLPVPSESDSLNDSLPEFGKFQFLDELPVTTKRVLPQYPQEAHDNGVQGTVVLSVLVGKDGIVKQIRVTKSIPVLDDAALTAVRQWVFKPGTRAGRPRAVWVTIPVRFSTP